MGFQEFVYLQIVGVVVGFFSWQCMVCVDYFIVVGYIGVGIEEQCVVVSYVFKELVILVGYYLYVFGGDVVGNGQYFVIGFVQDNFVIVFLGFGCGFCCWQDFQDLVDFCQCFGCQFVGVGYQNGW